ncbi:transport and Golgi organization protein 1-like protein, partial [Leptotrombidium deliense]
VLCWYTNALYLDDSVSVLVQCADPHCKGVISYAETQSQYPSRDERILSFGAGQKVTVYVKPSYTPFKLVFGEINGKKGWIPLNLIRETKIVTKNLVPVMLPKGISNIDEHSSDNNSDKSTAGEVPTPEILVGPNIQSSSVENNASKGTVNSSAQQYSHSTNSSGYNKTQINSTSEKRDETSNVTPELKNNVELQVGEHDNSLETKDVQQNENKLEGSENLSIHGNKNLTTNVSSETQKLDEEEKVESITENNSEDSEMQNVEKDEKVETITENNFEDQVKVKVNTEVNENDVTPDLFKNSSSDKSEESVSDKNVNIGETDKTSPENPVT